MSDETEAKHLTPEELAACAEHPRRHVRVTASGATHWSSGPGNITWDPECPACDEELALLAHIRALQQAVDDAADVLMGNVDEDEVEAVVERVCALATGAGNGKDGER